MRRLWRHYKGLGIILLALTLLGAHGFAAPIAQDDIFQRTVFDVRNDLELLADQVLGVNTRPQGWTGNISVDSLSFVADVWLDNELLADVVFGEGVRPREWFGVTVSIANILARNVRHDLELMATQVFGSGERPQEWRGSPVPTIRCERSLQNLLTVISRFYGISPTTPESALNYCLAIGAEIEDDLIEIIFSLPENRIVPEQAIVDVRADLDLLTTTLYSSLPTGYIGETGRDDPSYNANILLDLETVEMCIRDRLTSVVGLLATIANTMREVVESAQTLLQTYPEAPIVMVTLIPAAIFWIWRASRHHRDAAERSD